jgi:2-keto-3-deoxy-L-rhamnonate aldolase RhmA
MTGSEFHDKLHKGERVFGTSVTHAAPYWPHIIAEVGIDFVFIDNEHHPFTREQTATLCRVYAAMGVVPLMRVPKPDAILACMALDGGAAGVVAPYVESVDQVIDLVGAVRYSPLKGKVLEKAMREGIWPGKTKEHLDARNQSRLAIINIESVTALENLEQLISVPGLDAVLIGPHDLAINLGIPQQYDHPQFLQAIERIISAARSHDLGAGIHSWWSLDQVQKWMDMGLNLVLYSSDYMAARSKLREYFSTLRGKE